MPCKHRTLSRRVKLFLLLLISTLVGNPQAFAFVLTAAAPQKSAAKAATSKADDQASRDKKTAEEKSLLLEKKSQQMQFLLETVLDNADKITLTEHHNLLRVEAAALLWQLDQKRALTILKEVIASLRQAQEESLAKTRRPPTEKQRLLRAAIFRKVARIDTQLLNQLLPPDSLSQTAPRLAPPERAEGAWAIIQVAEEMVADNPQLAMGMALESLSLGSGNFIGFLIVLNYHHPALVNDFAMTVLTQLRDSPIAATDLYSLKNFVFGQFGTPSLQNHYFQCLITRLSRDLRPDLSPRELQFDLRMLREAITFTGGRYLRWQPELGKLLTAFEELAKSRAAAAGAVADPRQTSERRVVDTSMMTGAAAADTQPLIGEAAEASRLVDTQRRDKEHQRLAAQAALQADLPMAEDFLAKIEKDEARREATLSVYGPFVTKAVHEADWKTAKQFALKIREPLGRTLALCQIAQTMPAGEEDGKAVIQLYELASEYLWRELITENVVKGFLALAKSLFPKDRKAAMEAMRAAAHTLNRLPLESAFDDTPINGTLAPWIRLPGPSYSHSEALALTENLPALFREFAKQDAAQAQSCVDSITNRTFSAFAQLGIVRVLAEEVNSLQKSTKPNSAKPAQN